MPDEVGTTEAFPELDPDQVDAPAAEEFADDSDVFSGLQRVTATGLFLYNYQNILSVFKDTTMFANSIKSVKQELLFAEAVKQAVFFTQIEISQQMQAQAEARSSEAQG